jgi:site-specific recombinase XerD
VPEIRLYDLRHTFGCLALWQGADLKTVASIVGHDPAMPQRVYQHIHPAARRLAVEGVAAALTGEEEQAGGPGAEVASS